MTTTVHRRQNEMIVTRLEFYPLYVEIIWEKSLLLRLLCRRDEIGVTWEAWNRGEAPTSLVVLRSADVDTPSSVDTGSLYLSQEYRD